jgi:hypothetical protein
MEDAYKNCFGQVLEDYNARQKRADRKIDDYYTHLFGNARKDVIATSSNKEKSFYEIVVGIGDKNNTAVGSAEGELATKILDEYATGFSERNPNFYVFNSVLHLDEKTPHLHIDYIPIAEGYKNGMEKRNSQSVALQQMGFGKNKNSINEWRKQERQILRELCQEHGLEIAEETQGRGKTFTPDMYKVAMDNAKDEARQDPDVIDQLKDELRYDFIAEHKHLLVQEVEEQAPAEIGELKRILAQETRPPLEGKIATEQRINKLIDGVHEKSFFGKTKTVINFDGTAEEVMTALKAAQQSDKNRVNVAKFKGERDTAIKERDAAVKAKELAESQKTTAETAANNAESKAKAQTPRPPQKCRRLRRYITNSKILTAYTNKPCMTVTATRLKPTKRTD